MTADRLYRASAVAAMLGGTSIVVLDLMQSFADVPRRTVGLVEIPVTLFVLFGLPGLYLRQAARAGYLGLAAFVLVFTGVALGMGHFYLLAFARSVLDTEWTDAAAAVEAAWRTIAPLELLTFAGGWVLFAVTTLRSKTFPRPATLLILAGIVMVFVRPLLPFEGPVGGVLMGAGIAWLGMALFRSVSSSRNRGTPIPHARPSP